MNQRAVILAAVLLIMGLSAGLVAGTRLSGTTTTTSTMTAITTSATTTTLPGRTIVATITSTATTTAPAQVVNRGTTWDYLALFSPTLSPPSGTQLPGDSYAVVASDSYWTSAGKSYPDLFLSPGQAKAYQIRMFINSGALPLPGQLQPIDGLGLGVHFNSSTVNGASGGGRFTMTVSLAANFTLGVNVIQIPIVFSSADRIQPASFGPIYVISGFPGKAVTGTSSSGQPAFAFQDDAGRGYAVDLTDQFINTSMFPSAPGPSPYGSVCAYLDTNGALSVTRNGPPFPCNPSTGTFSVVLRPGATTTFVLEFKLVTQLGVQQIYTELTYGNTRSPFYSMTFSPSQAVLKPGQIVDVTVSINALFIGSDSSGVAVSAFTLEGANIGAAPVYSFGFNVIVSSLP